MLLALRSQWEGTVAASPQSIGARSVGFAQGLSASTTAVDSTGGTGSVFLAFVAAGAQAPTTAITVSDNKSNTWTSIGTAEILTGNSLKVAAFQCVGGVGGLGHVLTARATVDHNCYYTIWFVEVLGCAATSPVYAVPAWTNTAGGSITGPSVTTDSSAALVSISIPKADGIRTWAYTNGFTALSTQDNGSSAYPGQTSSRLVGAAGTYNNTYTVSPAPTATLTLTVGIKSAGVSAIATGASLSQNFTSSGFAGMWGQATGERNAIAVASSLTNSFSLATGTAFVSASTSGLAYLSSLNLTSGTAQASNPANSPVISYQNSFAITPGTAQGISNASAAGKTNTSSFSISTGQARGNAQANALSYIAANTLTSGSATGTGVATAGGSSFTNSFNITTGLATAQRNPTAAAKLLSQSFSLQIGTALGQVSNSASGVARIANFSITIGTATGTISNTASAKLFTNSLALSTGTASATRNATANAQSYSSSFALSAGTALVVLNTTASGTTSSSSFSLSKGPAAGTVSNTASGFNFATGYTLDTGSAYFGVLTDLKVNSWAWKLKNRLDSFSLY